MSQTSQHLHTRPVAGAFSVAAGRYARVFGSEGSVGRLRNKVWSACERLVHPPASILDINCGIGTDAAYFAHKGYHVRGLDIAPGMIEQARKIHHNPGIHWHVGSYDNMPFVPTSSVDLALSNFGGLNCTGYLQPVAQEIHRVLRPGGVLVLVVMPPVAPWEIVSHLCRGKVRKAFRRLRPVMAVLEGVEIPVFYYSAGALRRALGSAFTPVQTFGLNIVSPPPASSRFAERFPGITRWLHALDDRIEQLPFVCRLGDHVVVIFRKNAR